MGSKSATIIIFVIIALIAIGLASVCASITGTYHFNLTDDNTTDVNNTTDDVVNHDDSQSSQQKYIPYNPPKRNQSENNSL